MRLWIISYDISDDKARARVEKALSQRGSRVNYSVFECWLDSGAQSRLRAELKTFIDGETDSIRYYPLCAWCQDKVSWYGRGIKPDDPAEWIL